VRHATGIFSAVLLAWFTWLAPARAADVVAIVLSESGGAYAEVALALRAELPSGIVVRESVDAAPQDPAAKPRLVVAVGAKACSAVAQPAGVPTLCTLIPRAAFERIAGEPAGRNRALSALYLDQPPARQMALLRLVLPRAETVAMLFGPESAPAEAAHLSAATRQGLRPLAAKVAGADDLYPALQRLLDGGGDVLLAVPDASVYNAGSVQNILRTAIRARVPLLAFSPAYVRAGALAAVHSTPQQIGRQAGLLARELIGGRALPAPVYPAEFTVTVNAVVARSLGVEIAEGEALAARLRAQEKPQ
jgi:putative ABC transport system substrate-binding protein